MATFSCKDTTPRCLPPSLSPSLSLSILSLGPPLMSRSILVQPCGLASVSLHVHTHQSRSHPHAPGRSRCRRSPPINSLSLHSFSLRQLISSCLFLPVSTLFFFSLSPSITLFIFSLSSSINSLHLLSSPLYQLSSRSLAPPPSCYAHTHTPRQVATTTFSCKDTTVATPPLFFFSRPSPL